MSQLFDLTGKVALVTGTSRGLGQYMGRALARAGADLVITSRKIGDLEPFRAEVESLGRKAFPVELDVRNVGSRLSPGMFAQVAWTVRRRQPSLFVPVSAIATTTERTFVIRVRGGRTEWVDVKTGLTSGPLVEVFGDLKSGDEVAARGTDELKAGASVQVKQPKPA